MEASTKSGWDGACVGLELSVERLKSGIGRFSVDLREHFVLEVGVFDTGSAGR